MSKVSVILTTYNRPDFLARAIDSVFNQTFQDFEILLLDDNSDDDRQKALLVHLTKQEKVKLYVTDIPNSNRREQVRYSVLINIAFSKANGKYITYLCDDDYYLPHRLQRMVDHLDENPELHVVYGSQKCIDTRGGQNKVIGIRQALQISKDPHCQVDHSSVMHRSSCIEKVGYWSTDPDNWGHADGDYWRRLCKAGFYFYPIPEVLDVHEVHDGSWTEIIKVEEETLKQESRSYV